MSTSNTSSSPQVTTYYQNGMNQFRSGDYSLAIENFTKAIANSSNESQNAQLREMIAFNLLMRNQGDDESSAIEIYKSLVSNPVYPAYSRALALASLAVYTTNMGSTFAQKYFTVEPVDFYVTTDTGSTYDVYRTAEKMFKISDTIYPNSLAEYGIAFTNALLLLNNQIDSFQTRTIAEEMQKYIALGDEKIDDAQYQPSSIARQKLYKAMATGVSGRILGKPSLPYREETFKSALSAGGADEKTDPQLRAILMETRLNYAIFLTRNDFGRSRDTDIQEVLRPYADAITDTESYKSTRMWFYKLGNTSGFANAQIVQLAKISPEFKAFLESVSWQL